MLTGAINIYRGQKLVISTITGKLYCFNLGKDLKRIASTQASTE